MEKVVEKKLSRKIYKYYYLIFIISYSILHTLAYFYYKKIPKGAFSFDKTPNLIYVVPYYFIMIVLITIFSKIISNSIVLEKEKIYFEDKKYLKNSTIPLICIINIIIFIITYNVWVLLIN